MNFKNKIACASQCNYRLNRRVLCMKHSWDEVSNILEMACQKRRGHTPPPPPPPPKKPNPPAKSCCSCPGICSPGDLPPNFCKLVSSICPPHHEPQEPCKGGPPPHNPQKDCENVPPPNQEHCEGGPPPHKPQEPYREAPGQRPKRRCPNRNSPFYPFF